MRQLTFPEKKLLKKVDFLQWKHENNLREIQVMRRYHVQNREDYTRYITANHPFIETNIASLTQVQPAVWCRAQDRCGDGQPAHQRPCKERGV